jgi:hypothetical protein
MELVMENDVYHAACTTFGITRGLAGTGSGEEMTPPPRSRVRGSRHSYALILQNQTSPLYYAHSQFYSLIMKLAEVFSIPQGIKRLPEEKISIPLMVLHWVVYLIMPVVLFVLSWNTIGFGASFENPAPLSGFTGALVLLTTLGFAILSTLMRMGIAAVLIYILVQILENRKTNVKFWKFFNIYVYAKVWELVIAVVLNLILIGISPRLDSWLNSEPTSFPWILGVTTYVPIVIFYAIFIFGIIKTIPKKVTAIETL